MMMSQRPRKMMPPGETRKRKEREAKPMASPPDAGEGKRISSSNRLLAGYMAYEFLTNGTLFGQKFDPARAQAQAQAQAQKQKEHPSHGYGEVASILKADGTHIPGIVNPTQLSGWIQM